MDKVHVTDNLQYASRATAEPEVTQEVPLGTYADVTQVTHSVVNSEIYQQPYTTTNVRMHDLNHILDREYILANTIWDSTMATGYTIFSLAFPDDLFSQSFIADKIKNFAWFRAGVRLTVRVIANQTLYGMFLVDYLPYATENSSVPHIDLQTASGLPHLLMSPSSAATACFDLPFICQDRVLDIKNYSPGQMGLLRFMVGGPLKDGLSDNPCSCTIQVVGQFLNSEVAYPVTVQSSRNAKDEANSKSKQGTISNALSAASSIAGLVKSVPFVSSYASAIEQTLNGASQVTKMMGLSKPATLAITDIGKINPFADINQGQGLDMSIQLGFDQANGISTTPNVGGQSADEMSLRYVAGTPQLADKLFPDIGSVNTTYPFFKLGNLANPVYMDHINSLFQFHSGSVKVGFYIYASKYHNVKLVFWLNRANSTSNNWEDCMHRVVDVQGDTQVFWTIPYSDIAFASVNGTTLNMQVNCTILSFNAYSGLTSAPIYVFAYRAAAEDNQWGGLKDTLLIQSNPREDFGKVFEAFHPDITSYQHEGLIFGENYTTLRQVLHRYNPDAKTTNDTTEGSLLVYQTNGYKTGSYKVYTGLEKIGMLYAFWRGSIRLKVARYGNVTNSTCIIVGGPSGIYAGTSISTDTNPVIELAVPYYSDKAFTFTHINQPSVNKPYLVSKPSQTSANTQYLFKAAGDDFSFHFLVPLNTWIISAPYELTPGYGTQGLFSAMDSV